MNSNCQFFSVVFLLFAGLIGHPLIIAQNIDPNNIPDEIRRCVHMQPSSELDSSINPFYISGDYDGDGVTDFAVLITSQVSELESTIFSFVLHTVRRFFGIQILCLMLSLLRHSLVPGQKAKQAAFRTSSKKHDSLAILIGDEGGGLIYWDGTKFRWQQEE